MLGKHQGRTTKKYPEFDGEIERGCWWVSWFFITLGIFQTKCLIRAFTVISKLAYKPWRSLAEFLGFKSHSTLSARSAQLCSPPPQSLQLCPSPPTPSLLLHPKAPSLQHPQPQSLHSQPVSALPAREAAAWARGRQGNDCSQHMDPVTHQQPANTSIHTWPPHQLWHPNRSLIWKPIFTKFVEICFSLWLVIYFGWHQQKVLEDEEDKKVGRQRQKNRLLRPHFFRKLGKNMFWN